MADLLGQVPPLVVHQREGPQAGAAERLPEGLAEAVLENLPEAAVPAQAQESLRAVQAPAEVAAFRPELGKTQAWPRGPGFRPGGMPTPC